MESTKKYKEVIEANIKFHSKLSEHYNTCEPHFRAENVIAVEKYIKQIVEATQAKKLADFGCGTGFIINIAKKYVNHITGIDVTQAMMDKVDKSGSANIELINHDTGTVPLEKETYDLVTAYSFLHHLYDIEPTLKNAANCLKKGGMFYADLEPNYFFWENVNSLQRNGNYDSIVRREIEMVTYKDEDIEKTFGVNKETFNNAEFGKNIAGGFKEEEITSKLLKCGFSKVDIFYHWYIGQGYVINNDKLALKDRFKNAAIIDDLLKKALPLSKNIYKYIGFIATK